MRQYETEEEYRALTQRIIGAAIEVHKELGAGLLESVYEHCLMAELRRAHLEAHQQVRVPIHYKDEQLDKEFIVDIIVENVVVLELKAITELLPLHEAQLLT